MRGTNGLLPENLKEIVKSLKEADEFLKQYKDLCMKYEMIVDSDIGDSCISPVTVKRIKEHCNSLGKKIQTDLKLYESLIDVGQWRTPLAL